MAPPSASRPANPRARVHRGPTRTGRVRLLHRLASVAILAWLLSSKRMLQRYEAFSRSLIAPELKQARSILWVTAHPDDESFFFAPTMSRLLPPTGGAVGHLLCLSTGDHEGLGSVRRKELVESCAALGIAPDKCVSLDHPELPDSPTLWWPAETIQALVASHVEEWGIDLVVTLDSHGVSGHANHRALSAALSALPSAYPATLSPSAATHPTPPVYTLHSTYLLPKYASLLSLPGAIASHYLWSTPSSLFINGPTGYRQARQSFDAHASQARWFRTLFVSFSRYLWFAELVKVE